MRYYKIIWGGGEYFIDFWNEEDSSHLRRTWEEVHKEILEHLETEVQGWKNTKETDYWPIEVYPERY